MRNFRTGDKVFPKLEILLERYVYDRSKTWLEQFGSVVQTVSCAYSCVVELSEGLSESFYESAYLRVATQEEVDEELHQLRGKIHATKYDV